MVRHPQGHGGRSENGAGKAAASATISGDGSSGKRYGENKLSETRSAGDGSNRPPITLLKTTELTVRQYFDAVGGCPYDEVKWRRPCRT